MTRYFKTIISVLLVVSMLICVGCGSKGTNSSDISENNGSLENSSGENIPTSVAGVSFGEKAVGGYVGETVNITLTGENAATVKAAVSSNTDVAEITSVKDGVITVSVKTTGSSDISLSAEDKAKCTVYGFEKKDSTVNASDSLVKQHGRIDLATNGLLIENTAAGIEVEFFGTKLTAEIIGNEGIMRFGVVKDGVYPAADDTTTVSAGAKTYDIATFDTAGLHRVKILKSTEDSMGSYVISSLTVSNGGFKEVTDDYKLKMLVYGDGCISGHGNLRAETDIDQVKVNNGADYYFDYTKKEQQNGLYSYTALAANSLGAEYTAFCRSGMAFFTSVEPTVYLQDSFMCVAPGSSNVYDIREENPDIIVLDIGSIDTWARGSNPVAEGKLSYFRDGFVLALKDFIIQLTSFTSKDIPVYICYKTMVDYGWIDEGFVSLVEEGGLDGYNVKLLRMQMPAYADGTKHSGHPRVSDHEANAEILADYIKRDLQL